MKLTHWNDMTPEQRRLFDANTDLVKWTVNHRCFGMLGRNYTFDDAVQDGYLGLLRAAQKFDPERGFKFSTYALDWIRSAIQKGRADVDGVNGRRAAANGNSLVDAELLLSLPTPDTDGVTLFDALTHEPESSSDPVGWNVDHDLVMGLLPEDVRADLDLGFWEVAERDGITAETAKRRLLRLGGRIRSRLDEQEQDDGEAA